MSKENSLSDLSLTQLDEMNSKAKRLVELMKQGIVEFVFKKKSTGQTRKAKGTLKRDLIPSEFQRKRGRPKKRPDDLVIYYDVDKKDIRSFKDFLLKSIKTKLKTKVEKQHIGKDAQKPKLDSKAKNKQDDQQKTND